MTTEDSPIADENLQSMVRRGLLTGEEAARLQRSLDDQARQGEALLKVRAHSQRSRIYPLLVVFALFLALGLLAGYFLGEQPTNEISQVAVDSLQRPPANGPARPIDLSRLDEERRYTMASTVRVSGAALLLIIAALMAGLLMWFYNGLVDSRERVNAGWAQVENVYQRRLDLVPVLIDAVQTYMEHERETLQALTQARAEALQVSVKLGDQAPESADQMRTLESAQGGLQAALSRLFAVVENYPDLKASRNFLSLQDQLEGTENRIAMERRQYNEFARSYNSKVQRFPSNLVASMMDFHGKAYFQAEDKALRPLEDPFGRRDEP